MDAYERNPGASCINDFGLATTVNVASPGNNRFGFLTSSLQNIGPNSIVSLVFNLHGYDGQPICSSQNNSVCLLAAKMYLVKSGYEGTSPAAADIYGESHPVLVSTAQNNIVLAAPVNIIPPVPNGSSFKILLELAVISCTGNGLKSYVIDNVRIAESSQIPLPVHFKSFLGERSTTSKVILKWTTASEQNNKGFYVQRNISGEWKMVGFIFSQAEQGNSSSSLNYEFTDNNTEKGISQYRIQQVDIDGRIRYSDIKAVRGEAQFNKIVAYPNPSTDGKVNIVFEDNVGLRDVQVSDLQGRIVKSFRSVANNILVIEKLTSGFYTIKVTNKSTAATSVQKVVVK